mgnify:FL=1
MAFNQYGVVGAGGVTVAVIVPVVATVFKTVTGIAFVASPVPCQSI